MKQVTFQVLDGVDKGRIFRNLPIPVTIGREEGNVLRLNDERVSRYHAKVQVEDGDIILTDLDSTNGTRVNGSAIQIRRLKPGDQVSLGRSLLLFGTLEEINARRSPQRVSQAKIPQGHTLLGPNADENDGFDVNLSGPLSQSSEMGPVSAPLTWVPNDADLPPLPQKMSAAQSARLAEIFDFLHRGLTSVAENVRENENGEIRVPFHLWQNLQALQLYLARYIRGVADPSELEQQ